MSSKNTVFKKIIIGCDHGAVDLKNQTVNYIKSVYGSKLDNFFDFGVHTEDRVDYPDIAHEVCKRIQSNEYDGGILLCGTGVGISIAANKHEGIRAGLCHDDYTAEMIRKHNNCNILAFGGRTTGIEIAKRMVDIFLTTEFEGGRHAERVDKLKITSCCESK
ncbi:ribose-5-phosphate isomerase [Naegleria gruberi]|uniref:Ribose-5-phosphate isomerase n=1 Tax=Naegleria gruberi TaxID=5762 RepID=D2V5N8_NAEGR|nr:ribose-5-phosphate isomerase [Naegleria gruberi]EFC47683.1 ribose-5-phosphate isomerase [Naegleria gruberi]|eukprot:XP_002680427.1 ribose-5-phosphate isomerase [Naegleria gruberi strain NEG-M]